MPLQTIDPLNQISSVTKFQYSSDWNGTVDWKRTIALWHDFKTISNFKYYAEFLQKINKKDFLEPEIKYLNFLLFYTGSLWPC